jgi:hypothetical protein
MEDSEETKRTTDRPEHFNKPVFRGWLIVCGIAAAFVLYGLFAFFFIGDRQPADWDFGAVEDIPGESVYSTFPYRDRAEELEPQHVDEKPPKAEIHVSDNPAPPPPAKENPAGKKFMDPGKLGSR